ncbi:hypothetical protein R4Z09_16500 [Niallia oryzisoli]|uniref:DUF2207 domain-containing protein n=1 Tax=Niallia oryzisoli TaxID=1737571 RepID=A0ABZ2C7R9_9BACI
MLDGLVGVFILIFIVVIMLLVLSSKGNSRKLKNHPIPEQLGIQHEKYLPLIYALENALPDSYKEAVKNRILNSHPQWSVYDFEWTFFELKRFFLINSLLKSVPMYSERVDEIWHEMLMFTKEYETFSNNFYQEFLHHIPNTEHTPMSFQRGFFDWVYLSFFESTPNSRKLWGDFLRHPINREILDDFRKLTEEDLIRKYFREHPAWLEIKQDIIHKMKKEIFYSDDVKQGKKSLAIPPSHSEQHFFQYAVGAAVFYSIYEDDQYQEQMQEWYPSEYYKVPSNSSTSSCTGFACSSSNNHDSGGGSGDSSCSSCAGGCSS